MRAISSFMREVGISALSCIALFALRIRVSMSATGSVSIASPPTSELFVMPGMTPWWASSRRQIRQRPNLRYTARGRPHRLQRECACVGCFGVRAALTTRDFFAMRYCSLLSPANGMPSARSSALASSSFRADVVIATSRPRTWLIES